MYISVTAVKLTNSWRAGSLYFTRQLCLVTGPWNTCECSEALSGFSGKDDKFDSDFSHGPRRVWYLMCHIRYFCCERVFISYRSLGFSCSIPYLWPRLITHQMYLILVAIRHMVSSTTKQINTKTGDDIIVARN